ncbi:MAG: NAD(P)-dependent oxidoreductase [Burkholderiales bacterium]|nr:NAD(P)-dependent oxidoreductase [Burkholderiales bacterium]
MSTPRIGFIGIGMMGHGMAKNLLAKGYSLNLKVNRDRSRLDDLLAAGATEAKTNADAARGADIVIICVTGSTQVEDIVFGADGLLGAAREGLIVIDASTAEPDSTTRIREALAAKGVKFIDAPLARTPKEAEEGRLNTMVGADEATFEQIRPVLAAYCENIFHVGPPGHGHVLKLVNNFLALSIAASTAEAFASISRAGVSLEKFHQVVSAGGVNSGVYKMIAENAVKGDFAGMKFSIANARKDLRYYTHMTEMLPVVSFMGEAVHQTFVHAVAQGYGDKLVPSLIEVQEKANGFQIVKR